MTNTPGTFTEEQQELRSLARRFLSENSTSARVRDLMETPDAFDEGMWKQMAELGWMGIAIPEEFGGAGYTFTELCVLLEEMGRTISATPFFSVAVLGTFAVLNAADEPQKQALLPLIAEGTARPTLAFVEESGRWDAGGITLEASGGDGSYTLSGTKRYVLDGNSATHFVVAARLGDEVALFLVNGDADGVKRSPLVTLDMTRKQADIDFDGAPGELLGAPGAPATAAFERTLQLGCVALANEQVGGAEWCLDVAAEHAKTRIQFGRPIGSFQGVKHKVAEMLIEVEMAKSAAYYAAWAAAEQEGELPVASSLAKAYCSDAFFHAAATAIQVLGGIGFTWEHDAHLYFRRAKSSEIYLGDADHHRELVYRREVAAEASDPGSEEESR